MPAQCRMKTCIATKQRLPEHELLRVVADHDNPSIILADPARVLPGRGAWITATLAALEQAEKRHAFARALKVSAPVDTGHVRKYLTDRKTEH
ncbi:nucleic-acid-binding protein implicated in transcription termination [Corynebacterium kutscheri]|uniref:Nucleic-acid-binding protein implicated in transcription termination n=1 Tax=Corynebacterium kutscheri TaxID=35755 RepID=A0AB38VT43_9CORY|nr:YlxR family protein [Corynebacterium kutscheri]VEH08722.1 nucleic-acid-binding protein implicated in transcription termination [Corynebacterium kutscheri]VEH79851.1 nucleic-acid-binding protein implicated in transcription termination [Corynebacterium kutscheri]